MDSGPEFFRLKLEFKFRPWTRSRNFVSFLLDSVNLDLRSVKQISLDPGARITSLCSAGQGS